MSQNDLSIANQGFASFRSDLNSALQALGSTNSGTSAPSTTYANQLFYDTTNNILKIRNEDNDAFISLFTLDQANDNIESLTINGALSCEGFTSNGIDDNADATAITITSAELVGIGTSPSTRLHVYQATGNTALRVESAEANAQASINFKNDARRYDVGINSSDSFFISDDTASSTRLTINSSGNVGIGTTSPGARLDVTSTDSDAVFLRSSQTNNTNVYITNTNATANNTANLFFAPANNVAGSQISSIAIEDFSSSANRTADLAFSTRKDGTMSERLKIGANGHLFATSADTSLANLTLKKSAGDTIDYLQCRKTDNDLRIVLEGSGDVHNATGTFSAISDEKLKENIVDASSQWDDIKNIKIRNFSLKADKLSEANMIGVIAQEIEKISPNLVKERIDTDPDTGEDLGTKTKIVKYSILHTKAVKALQEAMTRIEALEAEVAKLKG